MSERKRGLGVDVLTAARQRIAAVFDDFPRIYVSFSGGKDSGVLLHLVADEARLRRRSFGLLFVDLEAQYQLTIDYVAEQYQQYAGIVEPYWLALPLHLRNAVSQYEPQWVCWEPGRENDWVRPPHPLSITNPAEFPFYRYAMEFEELVPSFGEWYAGGQPAACFVGIRSDESLNRWRTIATNKSTYQDRQWMTWLGGSLYNAYPLYDWRTADIWTYYGREKRSYNQLYDRMHQAGLSIHQARICQPYGDDQRKGLWLYHLIEPETWGRVVTRVNGANQGALYARESGNILGVRSISKPLGLTWREFVERLLVSMPTPIREHYENKIAVFLRWYRDRGYPEGIPDDGPITSKDVPSWARICKALLKNDYWMKGLSFTQHKTGAYWKYQKVMKKRRAVWGLI